jgi:hypothetical protein
MKKLINNLFKPLTLGLLVTSQCVLSGDYEDGFLEIGPYLASNQATINSVGPISLVGKDYYHDFGSYRDIGYIFESPIGLINDSETQFLSFEIDTNIFFSDPNMHLVLAMSGDSYVTTNNGEITNINDVQLSGRGPALGRLSRVECTPQGNIVNAFAVENYTRNRGPEHGNPDDASISACELGDALDDNSRYRIDVHASKGFIAYWIFKERLSPSLSHWELKYSIGAPTPEQDLDQYFGNIIIGAASRSINSSLNLSNVYVAKWGEDYTNKTEITSYTNSCLNDYCMTIRGENFDSNAEVWIRKKKLRNHTQDYNNGLDITPNEIEKYTGFDIYTRRFASPTDYLFFPIQSLDLQQAWIDDGLCFSVKSNNTFSNEVCHQRVTNPIQPKFMGQDVVNYTSQDKEYTSYLVKGNASPLAGGNLLKIMGNSWKSINYNYNVTANTLLTFNFKSNRQEPEINAVGLRFSNGTVKYFQVYGTQTAADMNQDYNDYQKPSYKTYSIPIGQYYTGQITKMIFVADEDVHVGQNTIFQNPKLIN